MSLSADKIGKLSVAPQVPPDVRDVPRRIQVTDGALALVAKGFGRIDKFPLPAGVYRVLVESAVHSFDQVVFVPPQQETVVTYPTNHREVLPSAAPVPGADGMHEYMRGPLDQAITLPRAKDLPCRVVFMVTRSKPGPPISLKGFRLHNDRGEKIADLESNATAAPGGEWTIFRQDVKSGGCILEIPSKNLPSGATLRQPFWNVEGWSTLIFAGVEADLRLGVAPDSRFEVEAASGLPNMSNVSVYFWKTGKPFAVENHQGALPAWEVDIEMKSQRATELALHSLVNGRSLLSSADIQTQLLEEKFSNPMLGILGCHLLLQREGKDQALIPEVLGNLHRLLPGHPDVAALEITARRAGIRGLTREVPPVSWPPMLRRAFGTLRDADWQKPNTVLSDSVCDRIRTRVLSGGIWTRWIEGKSRKEFTKAGYPRVLLFATSPKEKVRRPSVPSGDDLAAITGSTESTAASMREYALRFFAGGGKKLQAADLQWTGMSRRQAKAALSHLNGLADAQRSASRPALKENVGKKAAPQSKNLPGSPLRKLSGREVGGGAGEAIFRHPFMSTKPTKKTTSRNSAPKTSAAPGPITIKGFLAIDTDGIGDHHKDKTAQDETSAKLDKNGKFVLASDPKGVRFLNADTDDYAVAPGNMSATIKVGDRATVTLPNGKKFSAPVGDYGPKNKAGEFSLKSVKDMGVAIIFSKSGPIPTLDGSAASDIPVSVTFFPGSAK